MRAAVTLPQAALPLVALEAGAEPTIKGGPGGGARSGSDRTGSGGDTRREAGRPEPGCGFRSSGSPRETLLFGRGAPPAPRARPPAAVARAAPRTPRLPCTCRVPRAPSGRRDERGERGRCRAPGSGRARGGEAAARVPGSEGGRGSREPRRPAGAPHCPSRDAPISGAGKRLEDGGFKPRTVQGAFAAGVGGGGWNRV